MNDLDRLSRLAEDCAAYQQDWWRRNEAAQQHCRDLPGLAGELIAIELDEGRWVTTRDVYFRRPGGYSRHRQDIQLALVDLMVPEVDVVPARPTAYFTTGCPGSGKSTTLRGLVQAIRHVRGESSDLSLIDADAVRRSLPEFAGGLGSFVVDPECYDITYGAVLNRAIEHRGDLVYDTIGHISSIRDSVERMVAEGFDVVFLIAHVSRETAERRTIERALNEEVRIVDPRVIDRSFTAAEEALDLLLAHGPAPSAWALIDTEGPEKEPKVLKADDTFAEILEDALARLRTLP